MSEAAPVMSDAELLAWLRRRIGERAPAAVIRFGDGEAKVLRVEPGEPASLESAADKLRRQTGRPFEREDLLALKALVAHAFEQADVLGIGFSENFTDEHKLWMRRLAALHAERLARGRRPIPVARCLLGHELLDKLPELLAGRPIGVISCRDVGPILERDWGAIDVAVYQVPSEHPVRDVDGPYEAAMHGVPIWPDAHARVRSQLAVRERGEVFLVGAGIFGKDLCIHIRELGGIALDVGSALDRIAGKITRGPRRRVLDLHRQGMSVDEIAAHLRDLYGVDVEPQRIADGLAEIQAGQ